MNEPITGATGPDLSQGVPISDLADGKPCLGHVRGEQAILVRRGDRLFAIGAVCTHYGAPLAEGLVVGDTVRCPWHHACFDLGTGEPLRAPALDPVSCWRAELSGGMAYVREKIEVLKRKAASATRHPASIVIVGGGAAGNAAAEMLRREGYSGSLAMLSDDDALPCDRPNLSKGYLAGTAPYKYVPLRNADFYKRHGIDLTLRTEVKEIDVQASELRLGNGGRLPYEKLLLATGAEPVQLRVPGGSAPHVRYLRTLSDCQAIIDAASRSHRVAVIGASFIGLEVASSLRQRDVAVDVISRESCPMEKVLGREIGNFVRALHESHGVAFHLETTVSAIGEHGVTLANGERVEADMVVVGIGVRPRLGLAEKAGIQVYGGVTVNEYLETAIPGIYAAGDIALWPDPYTGESLRVEHWVVAERQGQTVARNMLGAGERFDAVPFFWTEQYDFGLAYVGFGGFWDSVEMDGHVALDIRNCSATYWRRNRKIGVALIHRDYQGLIEELEFERAIGRALASRVRGKQKTGALSKSSGPSPHPG